MYRALTGVIAALLLAVVLAFVFTLGYVTNVGGDGIDTSDSAREETNTTDDPSRVGDVDFSTLDQILQILLEDYVNSDTLNEQALYEAAINGLLNLLPDSGTFYIDPITNQISIGPSGAFEGIGATVAQQDNEIVIVRPIPDSPAEAAGVLARDVILAVDGESTEGWTVDRAVLRIRGPKGSDVVLTIRHLDGVTEDITITRDEIQLQSVTGTPPGGVLLDEAGNEVTDVAYIRIEEFIETTPQEVEDLAREAEESGMRGLIIDLRANPGGLLQETVDTADLFLDEGIILIEVDRDETETTFRARPGGAALDIPIVILQDEFSASGAEVLSAALRDNDRAIIIGEVSFGKGTVNIARSLNDGGALFVSIANWLTPNGILIEGVGVSPDVEVVGLSPFEPQYSPEEDAQIHGAIEHLRSLQASQEPAPSSVAP